MISVGFFKEYHGDNFPEFQSTHTAIQNKDKVLEYMKHATVIAAAPGRVRDIFTNKPVPGEMLAYSDGSYYWGSEAIYYFDRYNLKLPEEFINHIVN